MTNNQYKNAFLRSKVNECLHQAAFYIKGDWQLPELAKATAIEHLNRGLAFARQLPDIPKNRAIRAHIVTAIELLKSKDQDCNVTYLDADAGIRAWVETYR
jgi:hypothetical protein